MQRRIRAKRQARWGNYFFPRSLQLANWQENVGDKNQGFDFTKIDFDSDPEAAIKQIAEQGEKGKKWPKLVEAEMEILLKDLGNMGL